MFDKKWVLSELQNGRDYEDIMEEITSILNQASKEYEAEQKTKNKIEDMENILDSIYDYCIEYYGKTNEDINNIQNLFNGENDAKKMVDFVDGMMQLVNMQSSTDLEKVLSNLLTFLK